jgi:elongation factor Ts
MSEKVTSEMVKELRERTGVGMGKCKEALDKSAGDMEKAIDYLRKLGVASAVKKEGRETKEGVIGASEGKKAAALVEVNTETDFVAQNETFKEFVKEICTVAVESQPSSLEALLVHKSLKDPSLTVDQYRALIIQSLGENIQVKRLLVLPKDQETSFGLYSHMGGKIVALVEISGAGDEEVLARDIAMHVAAESPDYLKPEDVPTEMKGREEEIARGQVQGKPANIIDKIIEGKLNAFYDQVCLLRQKFIKDNTLTIADLVGRQAKKIGKPLVLRRFIRWRVGG